MTNLPHVVFRYGSISDRASQGALDLEEASGERDAVGGAGQPWNGGVLREADL